MIPLHALLIGIDHYDANDYCTSLQGAVADVEAMAEVLRQAGVAPSRIRCLKSRPPGASDGSAPPADRPTYEAMVEALQQLTASAQRGEQVLIHYSGHGGRTATLIPGSKGADGLDEGFLPPDVGRSEARYLRDVELMYLIDAMVWKGLLVTLLLDSCHSGGMLRQPCGLVSRGRRQVDPAQRPLESLVAPRKALEATWRRLSQRAYSSVRGGKRSQWLPSAEGFVLLAACSSVEPAYEFPVGGGVRGLLTYSLLSVLAEGGLTLSWQQVYDRLVGRMHRVAPFQTPVLEGETSRLVLGGGLKALMDGLNVVEVTEDGHRLRLGGGQAMGLRVGALFRLLTAETAPESQSGPIAEIKECGAADSWAEVLADRDSPMRIRPGDRAHLIDPGEGFRRRVAWPSKGARAASPWPLAASVAGRSQRFLEAVEEGEWADFRVAVTAAGEYEICYADGTAVADAPRLPINREGSASRVVELLVHLASFQNVRDLENRDRTSPLSGAISLELGLLPKDFKFGQKICPRPFEAGVVPRVPQEDWICLSITNHSRQALQITILDLQPGWGIEQVHPKSGLETLEGGQTLHKPLQVYVPPSLRGRYDILKVFATAEAVDFRWLSQPEIGHARMVPRSALGTPRSPLERLFAEIAQDGPKTRQSKTNYASRHWTSAQVEFEIV